MSMIVGVPQARVIHLTALRSVVTALLLVYVLVVPMATLGVVLCIGADGHVAFEAAQHGRCGTSLASPPAPSRSQTTVTLVRADHCGPCDDVPVLVGDTRQQYLPVLSPPVQSAVPVLALATDVLAVLPDVATTPSLLALLPTTSPVLRALRTVVLLH